MAGDISANRMEPVIDKTFAFALMESGAISANRRIPKNGGIWHTQLLVFQQLLPLPLSFKFSLFASSKKNERRLALARVERDLHRAGVAASPKAQGPPQP